MQIRQMLVSPDKYPIKCPYNMNATRIVVHNTYNDASANNEISYMINNNYQTSFHFAVDDKEAVQGLPLDRNGWHAGDGNGKGNREGIAIEICYSMSGGDRFIQAERNACKLIAQLLKERGWGMDRVTKHQDYANKYCPHRTLDMGWDRFLNMVREEMGQAPTPTPTHDITGDIVYQSYDNVKKCWLPEVINDSDFAGNLGNGLGGLRAKPKYGEIYIQTHLMGSGWLGTISSSNYYRNSSNGNTYAGLFGRKIDGIKIWTTCGYVEYRVHVKGGNWLPWVRKADGTADGYAGIYGLEIDGVQMR